MQLKYVSGQMQNSLEGLTNNSVVCRFDMLVERAKQLPAIPVAVCYPLTQIALAGALEAATQGLIRPILVGPRNSILHLAKAEFCGGSHQQVLDWHL